MTVKAKTKLCGEMEVCASIIIVGSTLSRLPLCCLPALCGRCGLKRAKGERSTCTVSLHCCHQTWAPTRLHFWKRSAEILLLFSDAEIPHVRDFTMQLQGAEHSPLWESWHPWFFYTVFKHWWIFIHVAEAGLPCKCILQVFCLPIPSCTSDKLQCYFCCLTEFTSIAVWTFPPVFISQADV